MRTRYFPWGSWSHSIALPNMSNNPRSFGFNRPAGCVFWPAFCGYQAYRGNHASEVPDGRNVEAPARQAYSHSASVGSR